MTLSEANTKMVAVFVHAGYINFGVAVVADENPGCYKIVANDWKGLQATATIEKTGFCDNALLFKVAGDLTEMLTLLA